MMAKYHFGSAYPVSRVRQIGYNAESYGIRDIMRDDVPVGRLLYDRRESTRGEMRVQYIESFEGGRFGVPGANSLGVGAMRQLATQLKEEGVHTISGNRVTGTHRDAGTGRMGGADVRVNLDTPTAKIASHQAKIAGDGHWVTINGEHLLMRD